MKTTGNKKYMIIAVSLQIWEFTARNNFGAARQKSNPQSATTYISERTQILKGIIQCNAELLPVAPDSAHDQPVCRKIKECYRIDEQII